MAPSWMILLLLGAVCVANGRSVDTMEEPGDDTQKPVVDYHDNADDDNIDWRYQIIGDEDDDVVAEEPNDADDADDDNIDWRYQIIGDEDEDVDAKEPNDADDADDDNIDWRYQIIGDEDDDADADEPAGPDNVELKSDAIESLDYVMDDVSALEDELAGEVKAELEDYFQNYLTGCSGGQCTYCLFKKFGYRVCLAAKFSSNGIDFSLNVNGKSKFRYRVAAGGNKTIRVSKKKFPKRVRKFIKKDLTIYLRSINLRAKSFCFKVSIGLRWVGTIRYPRHGYKCIKL